MADVPDPCEAAGPAVVSAAFAGDEPAEHAVRGRHLAVLCAVVEGGTAELALPRQRTAHLCVLQRPFVDVGIAAIGEIDQGQAAFVGKMACRTRTDLQARGAVAAGAVVGFAGQRQAQVQHVAGGRCRCPGDAATGGAALDLPGIDALQAVDARRPGEIAGTGLPGSAEAIQRGQRGAGVAALQEAAVVGAGAIVQGEVLLELADSEPAGITESAADEYILGFDAVAGKIGFHLVIHREKAAGYVQPRAAYLGVVPVRRTAAVVVESGEIQVQPTAHGRGDGAIIPSGGHGRQDGRQRGTGDGGSPTGNSSIHGPSQVHNRQAHLKPVRGGSLSAASCHPPVSGLCAAAKTRFALRMPGRAR